MRAHRRYRCRYAGLLPASQRSFGPQPPLAAGRALGLRAYFQQQSMRSTARCSQPQPAPSTSGYPVHSQQHSQPYQSSQELTYAPDLQSQHEQYSETQDPRFISYSQPQAVPVSQQDASIAQTPLQHPRNVAAGRGLAVAPAGSQRQGSQRHLQLAPQQQYNQPQQQQLQVRLYVIVSSRPQGL